MPSQPSQTNSLRYQFKSSYPTKANQSLQKSMSNSAPSKDQSFRAIPSVDQLLRTDEVAQLRTAVGLPRLTAIAREVTEELRSAAHSKDLPETTKSELLKQAVE